MPWIIGIVGFIVGAAAGALLFKIFRSDEAKVKELEQKLQKLSEEYENYKGGVHTHFNDTANLLNDMTESYRKVYQHLANGAQTLCPDYISRQLALSSEARALLDKHPPAAASPAEQAEEPSPPLDYAARNDPDEGGALSEDYGIEKDKEPSPQQA